MGDGECPTQLTQLAPSVPTDAPSTVHSTPINEKTCTDSNYDKPKVVPRTEADRKFLKDDEPLSNMDSAEKANGKPEQKTEQNQKTTDKKEDIKAVKQDKKQEKQESDEKKKEKQERSEEKKKEKQERSEEKKKEKQERSEEKKKEKQERSDEKKKEKPPEKPPPAEKAKEAAKETVKKKEEDVAYDFLDVAEAGSKEGKAEKKGNDDKSKEKDRSKEKDGDTDMEKEGTELEKKDEKKEDKEEKKEEKSKSRKKKKTTDAGKEKKDDSEREKDGAAPPSKIERKRGTAEGSKKKRKSTESKESIRKKKEKEYQPLIFSAERLGKKNRCTAEADPEAGPVNRRPRGPRNDPPQGGSAELANRPKTCVGGSERRKVDKKALQAGKVKSDTKVALKGPGSKKKTSDRVRNKPSRGAESSRKSPRSRSPSDRRKGSARTKAAQKVKDPRAAAGTSRRGLEGTSLRAQVRDMQRVLDRFEKKHFNKK